MWVSRSGQDKEELFISPQTIQAFGAVCLVSQTRGSPEPPEERETGFLPPIKTMDFQRLAKNIHFVPLLSGVAPVQKATEMSAQGCSLRRKGLLMHFST